MILSKITNKNNNNENLLSVQIHKSAHGAELQTIYNNQNGNVSLSLKKNQEFNTCGKETNQKIVLGLVPRPKISLQLGRVL